MANRPRLVCVLLPILVVASGSYGMPIPGAPVLYATDVLSNSLFIVDETTAVPVLIGPFSGDVNRMVEIAYDPFNHVLYGTDPLASNLFAVDPATGVDVLIGSLGGVFMNDLAFDVSTGTLYGAGVTDVLYTIDTTTGLATAVGNMGFVNVSGLAVHPVTGVMYGVAGVGPNRTLVTIDKSTGAATGIATTARASSLDFHLDTHVLFATDARGDGPLFTIDITTGATSLIGNTELNLTGIAFIPEPATVSLLGLASPVLLRCRRRRR